MLSIFANYRIDTVSRLKALKILFKSFNDQRIDNWLTNELDAIRKKKIKIFDQTHIKTIENFYTI